MYGYWNQDILCLGQTLLRSMTNCDTGKIIIGCIGCIIIIYGAGLIGKKASTLLFKRYVNHLLCVKKHIVVIECFADWANIYPCFIRETEEFNAVGFDCEWNQDDSGRRCPVALLQLATYSGLCVLIRLPYLKEKDLPFLLKEFLHDSNVIKVGVGIDIDQKNLLIDYNIVVNGCVDVRYLDQKMREKKLPGHESNSLKALAKKYLQKDIKKSWVVFSDWEGEMLNEEQIDYASDDALAGIQILIHLLPEMYDPSLFAALHWKNFTKHAVDRICSRFKDLKFCEQFFREGANCKEVPLMNDSSNLLKKVRKSVSVRKTPLYHNCQLWAPDDEPLCICDPQKAFWYIDKGLGELVSEEPLVVRLHFEPAGRPVKEGMDGQFYLQERLNICVVCGRTESYIRKNIVPHEYRKYFPSIMKAHQSHDVVLLCIECHQISNVRDNALRNRLAEEYDAPLCSESNSKVKTEGNLRSVQSAGRALLRKRSSLPLDRILKLESTLKQYFGTDVLTSEQIKSASTLKIQIVNSDYVSHSRKVTLGYEKCGLMLLEQRWRKWFIETMQPKYLPEKWSVTHNLNKLKVKMSRYPLAHPLREEYRIALVGTEGHIDIPYEPKKRTKNVFVENFFGLSSEKI